MDEKTIQDFWQSNPCGDAQVGGMAGAPDYETFFRQYDEFRYGEHAHLLATLDAIDFRGKRVLEIGLGQGADAEQIIRRGGIWSGLDLTAEAVDRTRMRLELHRLPYEQIVQGSALAMPFADNHFDLVFSHGVLHHIPDIQTAQREIARILKPDGALIAMLYARWSLNYMVAIGAVRRLGLLALVLSGRKPEGKAGQHVAQARQMGLRRYLKMENFIHRNTDGPENPYAKVYDRAEVERDFSDFEVQKIYKRFMHAPPLPVHDLPLQSLLGWHLWVHLKPKKS